MKTIRCIIVDDEPPALRLLKSYVEKTPALELVHTTTKALEALQMVNEGKVDLLFLDIQMPDLTGLQLSKLIDKNVSIIFTTAYPQFAIESYEVNTVDYLLKPISFERFYKAILKVEQQHASQKITTPKQEEGFLFVKTDGKNNFEKIKYKDIQYIESIKNYVAIHLPDRQIITYNSLKAILTQLSKENFVQIHKSYIVSLYHIDKTDSFSVSIGKKTLPIGETYKQSFFELINKRKL